MPALLVRSSSAAVRLARARAWLYARSRAEEVLVVAASAESGRDLLREAVLDRGLAGSAGSQRAAAAFGWHRITLPGLAAELAARELAESGLAPVGMLASEAVVARVVHGQRDSGELGRYAAVAETAGFWRAFRNALGELRAARVDATALERETPELAGLLRAHERALADAGLIDRAGVFRLAARAARDPDVAHGLLGLPTLLLDVELDSEVAAELIAAVASRAPDLLATHPAGDPATAGRLARALGVQELDVDTDPAAAETPASLRRMQRNLFGDGPDSEAELDASIELLSAPGESRECVEIARRVLRAAREGVPFDRIGVLLRAAEEYRPHLEEAFARAEIPVWFARGARRPDPAGRALLALLACAAESLSARRFAEYLSLGEVPRATRAGEPPPAAPAADRWVAPDEELVPRALEGAIASSAERSEPDAEDLEGAGDPDAQPVTAGTLRAPRRWERLLVDAAVIGGLDRWERRLDGLERELGLDLDALDDPDDPAAERLRARLADLASLRAYALPLLCSLAELPVRARWEEWLEAIGGLAVRALRHPERVLTVLAELTPMGAVGPVELDEVRLVLGRRLLELAESSPGARYGAVWVGPAEDARGLGFDQVFVPGLAERLFPRKIAEEPILLDVLRARLADTGPPEQRLVTNEERVARERRALHLAVGAARRRLVLSYPRLDMDQSRPRVPSFYALEALRAAEGRLPGYAELAQRAETLTQTRVGWPAPAAPADAIDEAEHDLALLEDLISLDPDKSVGTARYLLTANEHLGRALRFRARRWKRGWTIADGLIRPSDAARRALEAHQLGARSYSPTALQQYAKCPYAFFLYAVQRIAPREVPEAIEQLDPLQRGSLVHDVQFELFEALRERDLLPVTPPRLPEARDLLEDVLSRVAERYREELAPAIERVWEDGVASVRADLREWLRRASLDDSGFVPWRFELAFGLGDRRAKDPASTPEPVRLEAGLALRGSIDLVERGPGEVLRVTDHKTGRTRVQQGEVIAGGDALQPVLYALGVEALFPDATVESGRLYYCTATGNFEEVVVPLDARARESARVLAEVVGGALAEPFLPAAPAPRACQWCDYRSVCGPYEELRTGRKRPEPLAPLRKLRELR